MSIAPKKEGEDTLFDEDIDIELLLKATENAEKKAQPTSGVKKENSLSGQIGSSKNNINITGDGFYSAAIAKKITVKNIEPPPAQFPFPYPQPYDIQDQFMRQLWKTIESARIGIFESPTGTGKSLSLICGCVHWLVERGEFYTQETIKRAVENKSSVSAQRNSKSGSPRVKVNSGVTGSRSSSSLLTGNVGQPSSINSVSSLAPSFLPFNRFQNVVFQNVMNDQSNTNGNLKPSWVKQHEQNEVKRKIGELNEKRNSDREKLERQIKTLKRKAMPFSRNAHDFKKPLTSKKHWDSSDDDDEGHNSDSNTRSKSSWLTDFLLDPYYSADEDGGKDMILSDDSDTEDPTKFGRYKKSSKNDQDMDNVENIKILYCSRTHSQITQFINELKRTEFCNKVRVVSLGSRKTLCINETLKKKSGMSTMKLNDLCLDIQKKKSKKKCCMYYDKAKRATFSAMALSEIHDVEDLVRVGRKIRSCPYYGSRNAVTNADIITMPYSMLLHKKTRDSLGVSVKGNVVVFDEAHNIVDTINQLHSSILKQTQIDAALFQLNEYKSRYEKKLSSKNLFYINQIITLLKAFVAFASKRSKNVDTISKVTDFLCDLSIDDMNAIKINRYIEESRICNKIQGYRSKLKKEETMQNQRNEGTPGKSADNSSPNNSVDTSISKHISPLSYVQTFLLSTSNAATDGRIRVYYDANLKTTVFKYIMLNPALHFKNIIRDARSVILAGGTMEPINSVIRDLMAVDNKHVDIFSCNHVVSPDNVLPIIFQRAPSNRFFNFSYLERTKQSTIDELGLAISALSKIVPKGMVVFLPSYGYLDRVMLRWKNNGVLAKIQLKKPVFFEPKLAKDVDDTLTRYKHAIDFKDGAIIFCVVNAKLSEGINFGDDMARAVVMVGLPFPHAGDAELMEKMKFLDRKYGSSANAGRQYYEDLCVKAVNQSIGRAVRHQNDHAAIILLDHRYTRKSIQNKLPKWIMGGMKGDVALNFNSNLSLLNTFYKKMKSKNDQK